MEAMAGGRNWFVIRKHLLQTAADKAAKGVPLTDVLLRSSRPSTRRSWPRPRRPARGGREGRHPPHRHGRRPKFVANHDEVYAFRHSVESRTPKISAQASTMAEERHARSTSCRPW